MAAVTITPDQSELINSLSQDEIPIKLRCAICSKLAVNAFRLPCCEQAICETCHSTLPSSCPVCEHTPVAAADCKPNKSLRTTIKVFLRTEEKKREALRLKDEKNSPPETPIEAPTPAEAPPPVEEIANEETKLAEVEVEGNAPTEQAVEVPVTVEEIEAQKDVPQPSIEEIAPGQESTGDTDVAKPDEVEGNSVGKEVASKNGAADEIVAATPSFGAAFGFDPSNAAGFPNMPFGGDFNQMQMMMGMQNGMNPAAFGNFPMMGIPGMSMDPMTMQNMMMNGGFGGMNGMNMGMGMGGFDGGVGAGFNNGWNGQQASWNLTPDNFMNPNASSMGQADYGANNSGFNSHAAGFNQGNYGRQNQYNDYSNNYGNQGFRGRGGRGRGSYSRGGYGQNSNEPFSHQLPPQFGQQPNGAASEPGPIPKGPKALAADSNVDEFGREIRQKSETKEGTPSKTADENAVQEPGVAIAENGQAIEVASNVVNGTSDPMDGANVAMPIQTLDDVSAAQYGQAGGYNGYGGRGNFSQGQYGAGRGNFSSMQPPFVKSIDVPINAPTGPKAMREGLPNTSLSNLRSRGYPVPFGSTPAPRTTGSASASVAPEPTEKELKDRDRQSQSPERNGDGEKSRDRSRERQQSRERERRRSRSRDRHRSSRHQERSHTPTEDEQETERRRERRREQRRRREEEREARGIEEENIEKVDEGRGEEVIDERSRSASPSESKRSSHRSRRDKDKYRERERDSSREREHKSSSHRRRSHRDRSRSRDRDRERSRERDRGEKDREREHRHGRHSRRHSPTADEAERSKSKHDDAPSAEPPTPVEAEPVSRKASVTTINGASNNGLEIRGASTKRKSTTALEEIKIPTGPKGDRDRDRVTSATSASARDRPSSSRHESRHESSHRPSSSRHESRHESSRSAREREKEKDIPTPKSATPKDPHEVEREARNRERLLKEAQRIAGLTALSSGGRKRSRDDGDEGLGAGGKGRRKKGRRGGGAGEDDEGRIARLEAEREGARWG